MIGQRINRKKADDLLARGGRLYDMRSAIAYRDGTLPKAEHIVLRRISELFKLPKGTNIILFGEGYDDPDVTTAIGYLMQYGFTKVFNLGSMDS